MSAVPIVGTAMKIRARILTLESMPTPVGLNSFAIDIRNILVD
jgi:hypothetical protein